MAKFKVGDKVIRVDPYGGAEDIKLGVVYELDEVDEYGYVYIWNNDREWLDQCRFVLAGQQTLEKAFDKAVEHLGATIVAKSLIEKETQMTAEQLREEIIRIDTRIEEARKDIENAQTERNSLVEKLREKGFEMVENKTQLSENPFLEIGAQYVINDKNSSTWMEVGVKVTCIALDLSSRRLDARVEDHLGNDDWVNSECLTKI